MFYVFDNNRVPLYRKSNIKFNLKNVMYQSNVMFDSNWTIHALSTKINCITIDRVGTRWYRLLLACTDWVRITLRFVYMGLWITIRCLVLLSVALYLLLTSVKVVQGNFIPILDSTQGKLSMYMYIVWCI